MCVVLYLHSYKLKFTSIINEVKLVKIIVGLGNPGEKYKNTRHNVGFVITGEFASKYGITGRSESKFNAIIGKAKIAGVETLIVQPLTFMNLSGQSILKILNWYKVSPENLLVVYDDVSLDIGRLRFRDSGSDGGHNGIKSIIQSLGGNKKFPRLKVGIGPDPCGELRQSYVLGEFTSGEKTILDELIPSCINGIETFLNDGIQKASNDFNGINIVKA